MNTLLIILIVIAIIAGGYLYGITTGKLKDSDADYIPDAFEGKIEDAMEDLKEARDEFKERVEKVSKEAGDVIDAVKGKVNIEGKVTKTKLRELSKSDLQKYAKQEFNIELDVKNKVRAVNEVYELTYPNKK
mgnify:FL=1